MTSQPTDNDQARAARLTIRTRRTLDGEGEETMTSTVYCPVQERSVAVVECEACQRFHSLHFDPATKSSSVVCGAEGGGVAPAEEAALRDAVGGLPDPATPLAEIMSKDVVCVRPEVSIDEVRALMVDRGFGGIPVVDADGKPIGIISRADVLRSEHDQGDTAEAKRVTAKPKDLDEAGLGRGFHVYEPAKVTAADVMSPLVLTLHESSNIGQASSLMAYEGVHRLPVVSDDGRVVGILSSLDVLRWLGRRSGYLIPPGTVRRHG
jgi:CBS domain-containing protein